MSEVPQYKDLTAGALRPKELLHFHQHSRKDQFDGFEDPSPR